MDPSTLFCGEKYMSSFPPSYHPISRICIYLIENLILSKLETNYSIKQNTAWVDENHTILAQYLSRFRTETTLQIFNQFPSSVSSKIKTEACNALNLWYHLIRRMLWRFGKGWRNNIAEGGIGHGESFIPIFGKLKRILRKEPIKGEWFLCQTLK